MTFLTVLQHDEDATRFDLASPAVRIGRCRDNDLVLPDITVSRRHALIERHPDGAYIRDLKSRARTLVNDRVVFEPTRLSPGDRIQLGSACLIFDGSVPPTVVFDDQPSGDNRRTRFVSSEELVTAEADQLADARSLAATLELVLEADKQLALLRPLEELYQTLLDLGHRQVPFERGAVFTFENGGVVPRATRGYDGEFDGSIRLSSGILQRMRQDNASVLIRDALDDEAFRRRESIQDEHLRSVICVPLRSEREIIGLLYVDNRQSAGVFSLQDLDVLRHLASIAAMKIEHGRLLAIARREEQQHLELENAAEIQSRLFPSEPPAVPGYRLHGTSDPCHEVGGDYFDFLELSGGRIALGFGDVAGKGLQAALVMAALHSSIRTLAEMDLPVEETVARVDRILFRDLPSNRYSTLFYAILDPRAHRLIYVNAGHNPPLVVHGDGGIESLPTCGSPVGMRADSSYAAAHVDMAPGDLLLCYSDGITEAEDRAEVQFGEDRLRDLVRSRRHRSPEKLVKLLRRVVGRHRGGQPMEDDVTLLTLTREV